MKKRSFVYLGFCDLGPGCLFVKIGKSDHPEKRAKAYNTHCPGGLSSMYAAEVVSSKNAYATEYKLISAIRSLPGVRSTGGEWLKVDPPALDAVFDQFVKVAGEPFEICVERSARIANFGQ